MARTVPSPNPSWKPGDPIAAPVGGMIELDPAGLDVKSIYKLMIGAIVPRPIAFVSTLSRDGKGNLAPFSYFNGVSSDPPCVMIAITRKPDGNEKDTWRNIRETGQFVVNSVSEWIAEAANHCSAAYPYGVDEAERAGLTKLPSVKVRPPRIAESAVQMECELYGSMEIGPGGPGSSTIVVGRIVQFHVHESVYRDGRVLIEELKPVARIAGIGYAKVTEVFDIPRPKIGGASDD